MSRKSEDSSQIGCGTEGIFFFFFSFKLASIGASRNDDFRELGGGMSAGGQKGSKCKLADN